MAAADAAAPAVAMEEGTGLDEGVSALLSLSEDARVAAAFVDVTMLMGPFRCYVVWGGWMVVDSSSRIA